MTVLLFTHQRDHYTIDLVQDRVRDLGEVPVRVDTDLYPNHFALEVRANKTFDVHLCSRERKIAVNESRSCWARRIWTGPPPKEMPSDLAQWSRKQSHLAMMDALSLTTPRWINPLPAQQRAESKLLQLNRAMALGMTLPETLVTNNADAVVEMAREKTREKTLCTKLLGALSQTMKGDGAFVYTSVLTEDDLEDLDTGQGGLQHCPQIFQPLIEKRHELRVIVVGARTFAAGIDPNETERGKIDWRLSEPSEDSRWFTVELPKDVQKKAIALVKDLGLTYGALDFIVDKEDRHVFLELNPAGEWGWLQRDCELEIAEAIAEELCQ